MNNKGIYIRTKRHKKLMSQIKLKNNPLRGKPSWRKGIYSLNFTKKELIELYYTQKLSLSEIGVKYKTSGSTIFHYMKRWQIPSRKLSIALKNRDMNNEKHPNWQGGKSFEVYPPEFNKELKEQVRKKDNYMCQECEYPEEILNYRLSIHHIDYNKQNNSLNNLISLCKNCHIQTNYNRENWIEYYQYKLKVIT